MERASRQTRSQAAPEWSLDECLTLVNEINAVETEWRHTLASFQIWQLVVENCNSLEVNRSLNQCKKKWDALLADFKRVKPWRGSYWSFDDEKRKELELPEEFHRELFRAIDRYLKQKGGDDDDAAGPDTDPDSDPESRGRTSNYVVWETGPKKKRRKITRKRKIEETFQPWRHNVVGNVKKEPSTLSEVPELPRKDTVAEEILEQGLQDEDEKKMAAEITEKVELINAILQGNAAEDFECKLSDLKNLAATETDITRRKGDKLIEYFGIVVNALNQLCDRVQACNQLQKKP